MMSANRENSKRGRHAGLSSTAQVAKGEDFPDRHKYVPSGPSLSNVDRGEVNGWIVVNHENSAVDILSSKGRKATVTEEIPPAYECSVVNRGSHMAPDDFENSAAHIGTHLDIVDPVKFGATLTVQGDECTEMTESEIKTQSK